MNLSEVARVTRGIATRNRQLYVMTRAAASERGLTQFVRPVLVGARELPRNAVVVRDTPEREVVLLASLADYERHPSIREYLGNVRPAVARSATSPIVASYVGTPRFLANPDDLVILNALYRVTPLLNLSYEDIQILVARLNAAAAKLVPARPAVRWSPKRLESIEI